MKLLAALLVLGVFAGAAVIPVKGPTPEEIARLQAARATLEQATAQNPKDVGSWRRLGFVYRRLGMPVEARRAYEAVITLKPEDLEGWYLLALTLEKLDEREKAIAAWTRVRALAKDEDLRAVASKHLDYLRAL